ncbi:MAG: hypothetical protein MH825_10650 [Cyanobacteria bacterium]|nr:hypothetical protein [Cyanobacteriota bacterium]
MANINGTNLPDVLPLTETPESLAILAGNDLIITLDGNDIVRAFTGDDTVNGGMDNDRLFGNAGNDILNGEQGDDELQGGQDQDVLNGNDGSDFLFGNRGVDTIRGGIGNDELYGGKENDFLYGEEGDDVLAGDVGADVLNGGLGNDTFVIGRRSDLFANQVGAISTGGATVLDADTIEDFGQFGTDTFRLIGGLKFSELSITDGSGQFFNDAIIQDGRTGQVLAIVKGVSANRLLNSPQLFQEDGTQIGVTPPQGALQFGQASYQGIEGQSVTVKVVRDVNNSQNTVSVDVGVLGGSATAGADYQTFNQTLNFAAGQIEQTFTVNLLNDTVVDSGETIRLLLSKPTGGAVLGQQDSSILTILDVGATGGGGNGGTGTSTYQFGGATFTATEAATTVQAAITISRTGDTTQAGSVSFATSDGTATAGADYTATNQVVSFAAGETVKTVNVPVLTDAIAEATAETVNLTLTSPTGGTLGTQATATLSINDQGTTTTPPGTLPPGSTAVGNTLQFNNDPNAIPVQDALVSTFPNGINGGGGDDQFTFSNTIPATMRGEGGSDTFFPDATTAPTAPVSIDAGDGNDVITGSPIAGDKLIGGPGDDIITAGAGGGATVAGGAGRDTLVPGGAGDTFAFQRADATTSPFTADIIGNATTPFTSGTDKIGLGPDIATLALAQQVQDFTGDGTPDLALFFNDGGSLKYLAVLNGVAAPLPATDFVNVPSSTFTV